MLGELVEAKNLSYSVMQPINARLFNKNGFHTHGYKSSINNRNGLSWHLTLLYMIKKCNEEMFNKLMTLKSFKPELDYINKFGFKNIELEELILKMD